MLTINNDICVLFVDSTVRPKMIESTALGAALAAGFAINLWSMHSVKVDCNTFVPTITEEG